MARLQVRRGTAAAWTSANPTLSSGEPGYESDTGNFKFGDGTTSWSTLPYFEGGSGGGGGGPTTHVVRYADDFGAVHDGKEVRDGAMTNGSPALTSATAAFVAGDVGKSITVHGAGVSGRALSSTILSRQSSSQVTLTNNSNATVSNKHVLWGTDDTFAIRDTVDDAVAACVADKTYYCEVQFSAGIHCLAAATSKGGAARGNSQIPLPSFEPATGQKVTIVLKGLHDAGAWNHWLQTQSQKSGAVLRTMLVEQATDGTWGAPSVIGGPTADQPSGSQFSNIRVIVDGITVVTPVDPSLLALDLRRAAQADVPNFSALADGLPAELLASTTNQNGIGLYMPSINNNDSCNIGIYGCEGFYYGIGFSDHLCAQRVGLIYCNTAMFINAASGVPVHGATILMASVEACATIIEKTNSSNNRFPIFIGCVHTETGTGTDFKDVGNNLHGSIGYSNNAGAADPTVTGCRNVKIENVNRTRGNITAPSLPASTVPSTPIFRDAAVTISGGTVTAVAIDSETTGLTAGTFVVPCGQTITLTYSSAPTWKWTLL